MFEEEDRLPLTINTALSDIYNGAESCVRTIKADERTQIFKTVLPAERLQRHSHERGVAG